MINKITKEQHENTEMTRVYKNKIKKQLVNRSVDYFYCFAKNGTSFQRFFIVLLKWYEFST